MPRRVSWIPTSDRAFCDAATLALRRIEGVPDEDVESLLTTVLRRTYPNVAVHRQDPLARVFNEDVWYAYRDGQPRLGWDEGG